MAVLGKIFGGPGTSSFGRQQYLSEITIQPTKNLREGGWARYGGPVPPWPQHRTATGLVV